MSCGMEKCLAKLVVSSGSEVAGVAVVVEAAVAAAEE